MITPIYPNFQTRNIHFSAKIPKRCNVLKCKADCCNYAPLPLDLLGTYKSKIITPPVTLQPMGFIEGRLWGYAITNPKNLLASKCPFLTPNNSCNIYPNRPQICREYGTLDIPTCHCDLQE